jgi:hypothetical protein
MMGFRASRVLRASIVKWAENQPDMPTLFEAYAPPGRDRPQGETEMSKRPDAKWMRKEDEQLRAVAASGEAVAAISKRLCRSERAVRHRALTLGIKLPSLRRFGSPNRLVELGLKVKK